MFKLTEDPDRCATRVTDCVQVVPARTSAPTRIITFSRVNVLNDVGTTTLRPDTAMLTCIPSGRVSSQYYLAESLNGKPERAARVPSTDDERLATTLMNSLWPIKVYSLLFSMTARDNNFGRGLYLKCDPIGEREVAMILELAETPEACVRRRSCRLCGLALTEHSCASNRQGPAL